MHMAAWGNTNPAIISVLLDAGADLEAQTWNGRTPLHMAAINNTDATIMTTLIDAGADVNARADHGFTPLHWAAQSAEHSVVTRLLKGGADPNARTESGDTPLHSAVVFIANGEVLSANPSIIAALLKFGADLARIIHAWRPI